jgi:hypothetical protein
LISILCSTGFLPAYRSRLGRRRPTNTTFSQHRSPQKTPRQTRTRGLGRNRGFLLGVAVAHSLPGSQFETNTYQPAIVATLPSIQLSKGLEPRNF